MRQQFAPFGASFIDETSNESGIETI